ncbi:MAG: hypothetical protein ACERKV_12540 [Clostridiaceae bacterium]
MKYIGPFLRINTITKDNIKNQLFYFSKESIKSISLYSKCGITSNPKELNTKKTVSPLLCIYKKANPKLKNEDGDFSLKEESLKKDIVISANGYMSLCLLELSTYYFKFKDSDKSKYDYYYLYNNISKKQLSFYASYFRNEEGVFVDKKDISDSLINEIKFETKKKKFKFSDQAVMMNAYYKFSLENKGKISEDFKNFSLDILNMFITYRDDIYSLPFDDLIKFTLNLNIFYSYCKNDKTKFLLMDTCDYLKNSYEEKVNLFKESIEYKSMMFLNYYMLYKNCEILSYKEKAADLACDLLSIYDNEKGTLKKTSDKKEVEFTCSEIVLYTLSCYLYYSELAEKDENTLVLFDIYKRLFLDSYIILSWTDAPDTEDVERYRDFSKNAENLLEEENFKSSVFPSPYNSGLMPCFAKTVFYNKKKEIYSKGKNSFISETNMMLLFLLIYFCK